MAKTKSQSQASKKLKMQHRHDLKPLQHSQTSHQFLPISQQQTKRKIKIHQNNRKKKKTRRSSKSKYLKQADHLATNFKSKQKQATYKSSERAGNGFSVFADSFFDQWRLRLRSSLSSLLRCFLFCVSFFRNWQSGRYQFGQMKLTVSFDVRGYRQIDTWRYYGGWWRHVRLPYVTNE